MFAVQADREGARVHCLHLTSAAIHSVSKTADYNRQQVKWEGRRKDTATADSIVRVSMTPYLLNENMPCK